MPPVSKMLGMEHTGCQVFHILLSQFHARKLALQRVLRCALACVQLLGLRSFRVAAVLLAGLLAYDVFWGALYPTPCSCIAKEGVGQQARKSRSRAC